MAKLTRETMTAQQLIEYRDYIVNGWMPYHLADPDAIITEIAWIDAMLEREEEGNALFASFVNEYDKFEREEKDYQFYTDEDGNRHLHIKLANERISLNDFIKQGD